GNSLAPASRSKVATVLQALTPLNDAVLRALPPAPCVRRLIAQPGLDSHEATSACHAPMPQPAQVRCAWLQWNRSRLGARLRYFPAPRVLPPVGPAHPRRYRSARAPVPSRNLSVATRARKSSPAYRTHVFPPPSARAEKSDL